MLGLKASLVRFELTTCCLEGSRSVLLSYRDLKLNLKKLATKRRRNFYLPLGVALHLIAP